MQQPRPLPNCPIVEALIDFRTQVSQGLRAEEIEERAGQSALGYVKKGPVVKGSFGFTVTPQNPAGATTVSATSVIGVRLHSSDEKYVAQFTLEGFTLSRLRPYESWGDLVREARRAWEIYCECVRPLTISRAATRFVNNLQLPAGPMVKLEDYLKAGPQLPEALPQLLSGFLQRVVVLDPETEAIAIVTQALEQTAVEGTLPVIVDIDVNKQSQFETSGMQVWDYLDRLRDLKNRFFFNLLTEKALELYQ